MEFSCSRQSRVAGHSVRGPCVIIPGGGLMGRGRVEMAELRLGRGYEDTHWTPAQQTPATVIFRGKILSVSDNLFSSPPVSSQIGGTLWSLSPCLCRYWSCKRSIDLIFTITEKAHMPTSTVTFKTLLRRYAKQALTQALFSIVS